MKGMFCVGLEFVYDDVELNDNNYRITIQTTPDHYLWLKLSHLYNFSTHSMIHVNTNNTANKRNNVINASAVRI